MEMIKATRLFLLSLLILLATCKKDESADKTGENKSSPFYKQSLDRLKAAGLTTHELETTAAKPYGAKECARGEIEKLDLLVCRYANEAEAKGAQTSFDDFLGSAVSGLLRRYGSLIFAIADRNKSDPQGKQLNKILHTLEKPS
jgi:hypothetical protein